MPRNRTHTHGFSHLLTYARTTILLIGFRSRSPSRRITADVCMTFSQKLYRKHFDSLEVRTILCTQDMSFTDATAPLEL